MIDAALIVFAFIAFLLGFFSPWFWLFTIAVIAVIVPEHYQKYKLDQWLKENPYVPKPEPILGMSEYDVEWNNNWGFPSNVREILTEGKVVRERTYTYKGALTTENGILVKIEIFDKK
jgi:hypothetical protein